MKIARQRLISRGALAVLALAAFWGVGGHEVRVGDTVAWTNQARTKHTATSDDEGKTFDTGGIAPGRSSKSVKFETEGEFRYYCKVHGKIMSGTIVVKGRTK